MTVDLIKLIFRNCTRHRLRTSLTIIGIAIALLAFCFIRTMIVAWYAGVEGSAKNRLVTRNQVSLVFYLPIAYYATITQVPGVEKVGYANWFGGIYKDERYRFAQFAIDRNYLDIYPEYLLSAEERKNFEDDRQGAVVGEELAEQFGFKVGDVIQLKGTIFPGTWKLTIRGIYRGRDDDRVTRSLFFHWDYLNEVNKREILRQPDHTGLFVIQLKSGAEPAVVSKAIDERFANSFAETLTESETAFQQSFVSMSSSILLALNMISLVVIVIMLLVLANTMLMSLRERSREYSILKSLGFGGKELALIIFGESLLICLTGFILTCLALIPIFTLPAKVVLGPLINFFPVFTLRFTTLFICLVTSIAVAFIAGVGPLVNVLRLKVTDGLRRVG